MILPVFLLLGTSYPPPAYPDPDETGKAINTFTFDFLKSLPEGTYQQNAIISPQSIFHSYAMLYIGSEGKTHAELAKTFHFPANETSLLNSLSVIRAGIKGSNTEFTTVSLANAIQYGGLASFQSDFLEKCSKNNEAFLRNDSFSNPQASSKDTNDWVSEKTHGRISDTISPQDLIIEKTDSSRHPALTVTNVIYFKSDWLEKFNAGLTRPLPFFPDKNTKTEVEMMSGSPRGDYFGNDDFQYLELPYKGKAYRMGILLPRKNLSPVDIVDFVSAKDFASMRKNCSPVKTRTFLPKFEIENKLDLPSILSQMGTVSAFEDNASFGRMFHWNPLAERIYINDSRQDALIKVDEEGSEAVAVTTTVGYSIGCSTSPIMESPIIEFRANHPFMFFIIHDASQTILFSGWYNGPEN
ncbi:MAG: serpin family protein [Puniceicoccales bacterium]|jgi:serpin B|nr:serpin family protein [Puniceicoccales bacterium]